MTLTDNLRGALYMNLSMFAFTVNDAFMKSVTHDLPLFQTIALRGTVAVLCLLAVARITGGLRGGSSRCARWRMWRRQFCFCLR
jgi:drug/metabolite transporter (DMT)-like permease